MRAPPLLVSFSDLDSFLKSLTDENKRKHSAEIAALVEKGLPPAASSRCVAALFGYSPKFLISLTNRTEKYYRVFPIRTGSKVRIIHSPKVGLKVVQKWLSKHWQNSIIFDDNVHGFVKGKSSITAAQCHANASWIYSIDIQDFFPTTGMPKVVFALSQLGYSQEAANLLAKLCCYKGNLAQGSPASPFLSNLIFKPVDKIISDLASTMGVRYTRYADDLVFSGLGEFPEEIKVVKNIIEAEGWKISAHKEFFSKLPNRLKVHGLLVHADKPRLTKGYRNRIRAYKHLLKTKNNNLENKSVIEGHLAYALSVERHNDKKELYDF